MADLQIQPPRVTILHNLSQAALHPDQPDLAENGTFDLGVTYEKQARLETALEATTTAWLLKTWRLSDEGKPIMEGLAHREIDRPAAEQDLLLVHPPEYLAAFKAACQKASRASPALAEFGSEFFVGPQSYQAAATQVQCAIEGCKAILSGELTHALVLARPPGHHSEPNRAMGFCGFSTAAISALKAQQLAGAQGDSDYRVCVIDFDVHSGNGTIAALRDRPNILFCELRTVSMDTTPPRAYPYPRGQAEVPGAAMYDYAPSGGNLALEDLRFDPDNARRLSGESGDRYLATFATKLLPKVQAFRPNLVIFSAGFDCMAFDPLGDLGLLPIHIAELTHAVVKGQVPSLTILEGGYELRNLWYGLTAHVKALTRSHDERPISARGRRKEHKQSGGRVAEI